MTGQEIPHDVVIVGAGPAGATAALLLAKKGLNVVLVDAAKYPRKNICAGWLSAQAKPLIERLGLTFAKLVAHPFESVSFHNADFSKSAVPKFDETPGYLVNRTAFDERLVAEAVQAGARFDDAKPVTDVSLGETSVSVTVADGSRIQARLLVMAAGRSTGLLERLRLSPGAIPSGCWAVRFGAENIKTKNQPHVSIILGLDDAGGFGIVAVADGRATVSVQTAADKSTVVGTITLLCKRAVEHGILDVDLSHEAARASVVTTPAAVALAMETHVAKRTLIIGDAGGFVSATSGEGIYPAMWSARVASEIIEAALKSPSPQDVLMEFNTQWRTEMAEYLRPPNTDTQYILPLVFSNQPMADRMGSAFFSGENI